MEVGLVSERLEVGKFRGGWWDVQARDDDEVVINRDGRGRWLDCWFMQEVELIGICGWWS